MGLKVRVGKTYIDGQNCKVRIVAKLKTNDKYTYLGVINWSSCKCVSSRDGEETTDMYAEDGKISHSDIYFDFHLKKEE